jgi:hypothetical protein
VAYRVLVPLVIAKNQAGQLIYLWGPGSSGHGHIEPDGDPSAAGPIIHWLNDEQREHFLRLRLVEELADARGQFVSPPPAVQPEPETDDDGALDDDEVPDESVPDSGAVAEVIKILDSLYVPATAGAPAARKALRGNDYRYSNSVVCAAVRARKLSAAAAS